MKRMTATLGAVAIAILATACSQKTEDSGAAGKSETVADVDGYKISREMYDVFVNNVSNGEASLTEQQRKDLLENIVRGRLLAREAEASGLEKGSEIRAQLELSRLNVLSQAASAKYLKDHPATEAEMKAEYDKRVATVNRLEYRASHILVKTDAEARKIIEQLKSGGNFAAIAKAQSQDPVSKEKGGDLEWFSPGNFVPEFANAVTSLAKGQTSAAPVQTEYGYHVIRVTDTREAVPPPFEQVKDQMQKIVETQKTTKYLEELDKKSKITRTL
jgi:peptidyl-prolyl cis-trans isomerase C